MFASEQYVVLCIDFWKAETWSTGVIGQYVYQDIAYRFEILKCNIYAGRTSIWKSLQEAWNGHVKPMQAELLAEAIVKHNIKVRHTVMHYLFSLQRELHHQQ